MAVFDQRDSGYWQARVRRKGWPVQSKTFRTRSEAEIWARSVETNMDRGAFVSTVLAEKTLFKDLAKSFKSEFAPHHYRGEGWKLKLDRLTHRLGEFSVASLTQDRVAWYRDERLKDPDPRYSDRAKAPRISGATVKTEIDHLSKVLDVGSKEFRIPMPAGNPVALIRKPTSAPPRDRRLTKDEFDSLMVQCKRSRNHWLAAAVQLSVETAMRQGELMGLTRSDLDLSNRVAYLRVTKNGEARAVPLTSQAIAIFERLPKPLGKQVIPQDTKTLYSAFKAACGRADIVDFTWHDLRHEALSRLAERGDLSVLELSAVSGHKTLRLVQMYVKLHAKSLALKLG